MNNESQIHPDHLIEAGGGELGSGFDSMVPALGEFVLLQDMGPDARLVDLGESHEPSRQELEEAAAFEDQLAA